MKYCDSCHTKYPTDFNHCPRDGTILRGAGDLKQPQRRTKRTLIVVGTLLTTIVLVLAWFLWVRRDEANEANEVPTASVTDKKDAVAAKSVKRPHRAQAQTSSTKKREAAQQHETPLEEHVRAQTLVAQGYRRMEQRDFEEAEDAFQQALEIEPNNAAAQKGLRGTKTAQTVQGVAGIVRR